MKRQFFNHRLRGRPAFTLVEILVVIVIIAMLAGMVMGALQRTRESARVRHTEATIAKINTIIMRKYESYKNRRLPITMSTTDGSPVSPYNAAALRLYAIRDLQRMEMPDRWNDVYTNGAPNPPAKLTSTDKQGQTATAVISGQNPPQQPAITKLYVQKYQAWLNAHSPATSPADHNPAKCLYMIVMTGSPEARSMFSADEVADVDGDGLLTFIDGWGKPITWLRWAPGFTPPPGSPIPSNSSDIQVADPVNHHDPFDPRGIDADKKGNAIGYHLIPLIYAGVIGKWTPPGGSTPVDDYGIDPGSGNTYDGYNNTYGDGSSCLTYQSPCTDYKNVGGPSGSSIVTPISNHHTEQR